MEAVFSYILPLGFSLAHSLILSKQNHVQSNVCPLCLSYHLFPNTVKRQAHQAFSYFPALANMVLSA